MNSQSGRSHTYPLARGWRMLFLILALILATVPFWPFMLGSKVAGTLTDFVCLGLFTGGLAALSLLYVVSSRLVTSPAGIESQLAFWHAAAPWSTIQRVEANAYGVVLVFSQPHTRSRLLGWFYHPLGFDRLFQISPFVDGWQNSELLNDIRRYAPQAAIPDELARRPSLPWLRRTLTLAVYYLVIFFMTPLAARWGGLLISSLMVATAFPTWTPDVWNQAFLGLMGGVVGGAAALFDYDAKTSLNTHQIATYARVLYLLPLSGFAIGLVVALVAQVVASHFGDTRLTRQLASLLRISPFLLGLLQVYLIDRLWPELRRPSERKS